MSPTKTTSPPTLVRFLWSERRRFAPGLALACGRILSIAALPLIFRRIVDHDMAAKDLRGIAIMSAITIGLLVVHQWLSVRGAARLGTAVTRATLALRARVFDKIGDLSFTYLDRQKTGKLLAKYAYDTQKIEGVGMPILNGFLPNTLYSLLTIAILVSMNWQLCGAVLLMMPILAIMRQRYFEPMRLKNEATRLAQERLTGTASEYLNAIRLVRSYGKEDRAGDELAEVDRTAARTRVELIALSTSFGAFTFASIQFLSLFVIAGGAMLSIYGQVTPGTVLAFVAALPALVQPIQAFANVADQMFVGGEAYRSLRELLDEPETEPWRGTRTLSPIRGRIEFDNVVFRYPGAERDAVSGLSLTIEPGERVALVGASGAGKSTIASLLLGLYHAGGGEVRIDGVPQRELDVGWLRRQVGVVMQESVLLSGTIAENLRFGRADATDEQVRDAARRANADAFIAALPSGYDTVVGERGATLSGGQRQRIAIARALLRDPTILILDEPTSALDYESERLIQRALDTLARGRTTVTIAHRLSTIRNADRIIVLDAGRVVEQGTYDALRSGGTHFRRLLKSASESADASAA